MVQNSKNTPVVLGVSLKMYFGHQRTLDWCRQLVELSKKHPAFRNGLVECFVLPTTASLAAVAQILENSPVKLGAQDLFEQDAGAYTGGVSPAVLREIGCEFVEIAHAERRRYFGEDDDIFAKKLLAASRNDLTPVLCVGEEVKASPEEAAMVCISQIQKAVSALESPLQNLIVAYEPVWAIGAEVPASADYIAAVCDKISSFLKSGEVASSTRVIYGGSAGPGLLTELKGAVGGLFLGRFAHEMANLEKTLDEVYSHSTQNTAGASR